MAKMLRSLLRKTLFGKLDNLVSLDDPFSTLARLLEGRPVRAIVDAGASDGRVSRRLLEWFPESTVYAFEPNPSYEEALSAFAASESRFKPQYCALADAAGQRSLHVTRSPGATSFFEPLARLRDYETRSADVVRTIEVPTARLDDWAADLGVAGIDVIKLDVQGGEVGVLEGAGQLLEHSVSAVYTETLFNPTVPTQVDFVQARDPRVSQGSSLKALDRLARSKGYCLVATTKLNALFVEQRHFAAFGIADNSVEAMRADDSAVTYLFNGYDGTVFVRGLGELWDGIGCRTGNRGCSSCPAGCGSIRIIIRPGSGSSHGSTVHSASGA